MAYWLSKILLLAVLPLSFSLILLLVGLIGRWRWPVITGNALGVFAGLGEPVLMALGGGTLAT